MEYTVSIPGVNNGRMEYNESILEYILEEWSTLYLYLEYILEEWSTLYLYLEYILEEWSTMNLYWSIYWKNGVHCIYTWSTYWKSEVHCIYAGVYIGRMDYTVSLVEYILEEWSTLYLYLEYIVEYVRQFGSFVKLSDLFI